MDCFGLCLALSVPAGLKQIHALSIQGNYELRIDLEDFENSTAYAQYGTFGVGLFSVDPDDDGYPLTVGDYSGNAGMYSQWDTYTSCICLIRRFREQCNEIT